MLRTPNVEECMKYHNMYNIEILKIDTDKKLCIVYDSCKAAFILMHIEDLGKPIIDEHKLIYFKVSNGFYCLNDVLVYCKTYLGYEIQF